MTATWPGTLPQRFRIEGNQEAMPDGRLMTDNDRGPPKSRPGSSALGRPYSASWRMTGAQIDILEAFVRVDLGKGTLPFEINSPRDTTWLVTFAKGGLPSWVNIGGDRYNVSATLLVMP